MRRKAYVSEDMQNAFLWKRYGKTQTLRVVSMGDSDDDLLGFAHVSVARTADRKKEGKLSFGLFHEFHCIFESHNRLRFSHVVAQPSHDFRFHRAFKKGFHARSIVH